MNPILFEDLANSKSVLDGLAKLEAANAKFADSAVAQNARVGRSIVELASQITTVKGSIASLNTGNKTRANTELVGLKDDVAGLGKALKDNQAVLQRNQQFLDTNTASVTALKKRVADLKTEYDSLDRSEAKNVARQKQIAAEVRQTATAVRSMAIVTKEAAKVSVAAERSYDAQNKELGELRKQLRAMPDAYDQGTGAINKQNKAAVDLVAKISRADVALKKMDATSGMFSRNVGNYPKGGFLGSLIGEVSGPALSLLTGAGLAAGMMALGTSIISVRAEYQRLEKQLETTLGSKGAAKEAQDLITNFANKTPHEIAGVTSAFNRLVDVGIIPTEKQLFQLSDVALSKGKTINDYVEAIADAQQGEFERLKEFGVNAQKSGDQVIFTFKGQQTAVENTSSAINDYLIGLGSVAGVAGQTEQAGKTLSGQWSTLMDTLKGTANVIGEILEPAMNSLIGVAQRGADKLKSFFDNARLAYQQQGVLGVTGLMTTLDEKEYMAKIRESKAETDYRSGASRDTETGELDKLRQKAEANNKLADARRKARVESEKTKKTTEAEAKLTELEKIDKQIRAIEKTLQSQAMEDLRAGRIIDVDPALVAKVQTLKEQYEAIKALQKAIEDGSYNNKINIDVAPLTGKGVREGGKTGKNGKELNGEQVKADAAATLAAQSDTLQKQSNLIAEYAQKRSAIENDFDSELSGLRNGQKLDLINLLAQQEEAERAGQQARVQLLQDEIARRKELYKEDLANRKAVTDKAIEIGTTLVNGLFDLESARNEQRLSNLEKSKAAELVRAGDNEAAKAAIEKKYDGESKKIRHEQDVADRNQALFNIAVSTAVAAAQALPNIPLAILIGVLGAVQLGLVLAKPLPQYADGKNVANADSYAGPALAGEAGRELWQHDGRVELLDKPTVIDVGRNDVIYPNRITERLLAGEFSEGSRIMERSRATGRAAGALHRGRENYLSGASSGGSRFPVGALARAIGAENAKLPFNQVSFDQNGVREYVQESHSRRNTQRNKHQLS